jgi:hypothetical protein
MIEKSASKRLFFINYVLSIFIYGLTIPRLSKVTMLIVVLIILIRNSMRNTKEINKGILVPVLLLFMFSTTFYVMLYLNRISELSPTLIVNIFLIPAAYLVGYTINRKNTPDWPNGLLPVFLSMVTGFVIIAFLSVYKETGALGYAVELKTRSAQSFWGQSFGIQEDMFASLGMCFLPVLFFGRAKHLKRSYRSFIATIIVVLFVLGIYVVFAVQYRSPVYALSLSFIISGVVYIVRIKDIKKRGIFMTIIFIAGVAFFLLKYLPMIYEDYYIFQRLETLFVTTRYSLWALTIKQISSNLMGGGNVNIGHNWPHNLWLDVVYFTGILPLMPLLIFHFTQLKRLIIVIRSKKLSLMIVTAIIGISISFFVTFMKSPTVFGGNFPLFVANCFFFGIISRLSYDISCHDVR